ETATGLSAGNFEVTVFDSNGCTSNTAVTLAQPTVLDISLNGSDLLCKGDSTGTVAVAVQGGTPGYTFLWNNPDSSTTSTVENLFAGIYTVTVTDDNGCTATGTTEVTEPAEFLGTNATPINASCFGRSDGRIEVFGTGGTPPYEYSVDGQNYNGSNLIIGLPSNIYTVYTRDSNGCVDTAEVTIQEPAELFVSLGPDRTIEFGDSVQLEAVTNMPGANYTYEWTSFSPRMRLSCRDCPNPVANPLFDITYTVRVTNDQGCFAEANITVRVVKEDRVFIANAFTPNDDGNNDRFFVQGGAGIRNVYEVRVFDRWGELVYKQNNLNLNDDRRGWDGTFRDEPMNPGVFTYVVIVEFDDRTRQTYKGTVTLIR
ncbi:MAG: gliding motility-associated C-terminal domain-containing protein, partial [Bacteroidota bacterium]